MCLVVKLVSRMELISLISSDLILDETETRNRFLDITLIDWITLVVAKANKVWIMALILKLVLLKKVGSSNLSETCKNIGII